MFISMRKLILLVFLLIGCGQENNAPIMLGVIDVSKTTVIWHGYANESEDLLKRFNETMECLDSFPNHPVYRSPYPYVVIVEDSFICGYELAQGCYNPATQTIYFDNFVILDHDIFKHEAIHWATGILDENSKYFQCEYSSNYSPFNN